MFTKFRKVTTWQKSKDKTSAFIHAIFGLHNSIDPFLAFSKRLKSEVELSEGQLELSLKEINKRSTTEIKLIGNFSDESLERKIASLKGKIEEQEKSVKEAETTKLFKEDEFQNEYSKVVDRYDCWYNALGRPPYYQSFNYRSMFNFDKNENEPSKYTSVFVKIWNFFSSKIRLALQVIFFLAYPAEIYFALPAFQYFTPENNHAAIAGAAILVGVLYMLGHYSGFLLLRSRINHITCPNNNDKPLSGIKTLLDKYNSSLLIITVIISLMVIFTGAALRTMVYDVERSNDQIANINEELEYLNKHRDNVIQNGLESQISKYNEQIEALKAERKLLEEQKHLFRDQSIIPNKADGYLAFSIYLALYVAPILFRIMRTDPYPEYHLISTQASALEEAKTLRELSKYNFIQEKKTQLNESKEFLAELEKEVEIRSNSTNRDDYTNNEDSIADLKLRLFSKITKSWCNSRFTNYYTVYMLLKGKKVKESNINITIEDYLS